MLQIAIEKLGVPDRDFYEVQQELLSRGEQFTPSVLASIRYSQLHLCCIGNAGEAACAPRFVQKEKEQRRERFVEMGERELETCISFLKIEQMYSDVMYARMYRSAPRWDDLNDRQKAWVKLVCVYNHIESPRPRIEEVINLLHRCSITSLPIEPTMGYMAKLKGLLSVYPKFVGDELFRESIGTIADSLLDFLPDEERKLLETEQLQDYSCASDCFRVWA